MKTITAKLNHNTTCQKSGTQELRHSWNHIDSQTNNIKNPLQPSFITDTDTEQRRANTSFNTPLQSLTVGPQMTGALCHVL